MATYSRELLSSSTDGKAITLGTGSTTIHTTPTGTTSKDEIYLWVTNTSGASVPLILFWGGSANPGDAVCLNVPIPPNSPPIRVLDGQSLRNGKVLTGAAVGSASALIVIGHVNRITD